MDISRIQDFDGHALKVDALAGDLGDRLFVAASGGVDSDGASVGYLGRPVGTVDSVENGEDGAALAIWLNADASAEAVAAISQAIRFESIGDDPAAGSLHAAFSLVADGAEAALLSFEQPISVMPFAGLLSGSFEDDILARGLGEHVSDGEASTGAILFVAENYSHALESGTTETVIQGFELRDGGAALDLSAVLGEGSYGGGSLEGYVELDDSSGSHTVLRVDIHGTGQYTDLAIIEGTTGLGDPDSLLANGHLIV